MKDCKSQKNISDGLLDEKDQFSPEELRRIEKLAKAAEKAEVDNGLNPPKPNFLSRLGGFLSGFMIGVLFTPLTIVDAVVKLIEEIAEAESQDFKKYLYPRSKQNLPSNHESENFAGKGSRPLALALFLYLITRPLDWLITLRPLRILFSGIGKVFGVVFKPFSYAAVGFRAGLLGSFLAVPRDWYAHSHFIRQVKEIGQKINSLTSKSTPTDDLNRQQSDVDSMPTSDMDSFVGQQLTPPTAKDVSNNISALEEVELLREDAHLGSKRNSFLAQ